MTIPRLIYKFAISVQSNLCFGEVDLGELPVGQETTALSFLPLLPLAPWLIRCKTNTPAHLSSVPDLVSESFFRESDAPMDESCVAPGSMQTSVRDLTRSQGELVRSSLENKDLATVRRRIAGKRTIIPLVPLALSDYLDSVSVPDGLPEAGMLEALEPSESDT